MGSKHTSIPGDPQAHTSHMGTHTGTYIAWGPPQAGTRAWGPPQAYTQVPGDPPRCSQMCLGTPPGAYKVPGGVPKHMCRCLGGSPGTYGGAWGVPRHVLGSWQLAAPLWQRSYTSLICIRQANQNGYKLTSPGAQHNKWWNSKDPNVSMNQDSAHCGNKAGQHERPQHLKLG
jgi:hypothetical protein